MRTDWEALRRLWQSILPPAMLRKLATHHAESQEIMRQYLEDSDAEIQKNLRETDEIMKRIEEELDAEPANGLSEEKRNDGSV